MFIYIGLKVRALLALFVDFFYQAPQDFVVAGSADIGKKFFQLFLGAFILKILPEKIPDSFFHQKE